MLTLVSWFNSPGCWCSELFLVADSCKPETVRATVIVARPATVAFYEGTGTEVLQTGAWGRKKLSCPIVAGTCVLSGIKENLAACSSRGGKGIVHYNLIKLVLFLLWITQEWRQNTASWMPNMRQHKKQTNNKRTRLKQFDWFSKRRQTCTDFDWFSKHTTQSVRIARSHSLWRHLLVSNLIGQSHICDNFSGKTSKASLNPSISGRWNRSRMLRKTIFKSHMEIAYYGSLVLSCTKVKSVTFVLHLT